MGASTRVLLDRRRSPFHVLAGFAESLLKAALALLRRMCFAPFAPDTYTARLAMLEFRRHAKRAILYLTVNR